MPWLQPPPIWQSEPERGGEKRKCVRVTAKARARKENAGDRVALKRRQKAEQQAREIKEEEQRQRALAEEAQAKKIVREQLAAAREARLAAKEER